MISCDHPLGSSSKDTIINNTINSSNINNNNRCRIVLLGDPRVGKTSLVDQLAGLGFVEDCYEPTLLDTMVLEQEVDGVPYTMEIMDCTSEKSFAMQRSPYIASADVILFVYSALNKTSLHNVKKYASEVAAVRKANANFSRRRQSAASSTGRGRTSVDSTNNNNAEAEEEEMYRPEVPMFVVGTHADKLGSTSISSSDFLASAEEVTEDCLRKIGIRLSLDDRVDSKWRNAWHSFMRKIDRRPKGRGGGGGVGEEEGMSASAAASYSSVPTPPGASPNTAAITTPPSVPRGASARLPLYVLSAKHEMDVNNLFQAILRLHVYMTEVQKQDMNSSVSSFNHSCCGQASAPGSTLMTADTNKQHARTLSISSLQSPSKSERRLRMPTVSSLYDLPGAPPRAGSSATGTPTTAPLCSTSAACSQHVRTTSAVTFLSAGSDSIAPTPTLGSVLVVPLQDDPTATRTPTTAAATSLSLSQSQKGNGAAAADVVTTPRAVADAIPNKASVGGHHHPSFSHSSSQQRQSLTPDEAEAEAEAAGGGGPDSLSHWEHHNTTPPPTVRSTFACEHRMAGSRGGGYDTPRKMDDVEPAGLVASLSYTLPIDVMDGIDICEDYEEEEDAPDHVPHTQVHRSRLMRSGTEPYDKEDEEAEAEGQGGGGLNRTVPSMTPLTLVADDEPMHGNNNVTHRRQNESPQQQHPQQQPRHNNNNNNNNSNQQQQPRHNADQPQQQGRVRMQSGSTESASTVNRSQSNNSGTVTGSKGPTVRDKKSAPAKNAKVTSPACHRDCTVM